MSETTKEPQTPIRNDDITLSCLGQLYGLVRRAGNNLERAAITHLAADLGYTLIEIQPDDSKPLPPVGRLVDSKHCDDCWYADSCSKFSPCPRGYDAEATP